MNGRGAPLAPEPLLLDERSGPSLREVVGALLASAREACFAVARMRLAAIDLGPYELAGVERCRVLVGRLDADVLADAAVAAHGAALRRNLEALAHFLASGRFEVRAAGREAWVPDFSVFLGLPAALVPGGGIALAGGHYFVRPFPVSGPVLTCVLPGGAAARRAARRFEELWAGGYDVLPVVQEAIARALAEVAAPASVGLAASVQEPAVGMGGGAGGSGPAAGTTTRPAAEHRPSAGPPRAGAAPPPDGTCG